MQIYHRSRKPNNNIPFHVLITIAVFLQIRTKEDRSGKLTNQFDTHISSPRTRTNLIPCAVGAPLHTNNIQQVAPDSAFNNAQPEEPKPSNPTSQAPPQEPAGADSAASANAAEGFMNSAQKTGALNSFLETQMSSSNYLRVNSKDRIRTRNK